MHVRTQDKKKTVQASICECSVDSESSVTRSSPSFAVTSLTFAWPCSHDPPSPASRTWQSRRDFPAPTQSVYVLDHVSVDLGAPSCTPTNCPCYRLPTVVTPETHQHNNDGLLMVHLVICNPLKQEALHINADATPPQYEITLPSWIDSLPKQSRGGRTDSYWAGRS